MHQWIGSLSHDLQGVIHLNMHLHLYRVVMHGSVESEWFRSSICRGILPPGRNHTLNFLLESGELSQKRRGPVLADFLGQYSEPLAWWMKNLKSLRSRNTFTYISIEYESDWIRDRKDCSVMLDVELSYTHSPERLPSFHKNQPPEHQNSGYMNYFLSHYKDPIYPR